MDAKRPSPRHIILKMQKVKDKERILKAAREKKLGTYRGARISLSAQKKLCRLDRIGKKCSKSQEIFKVTKNRDLQPRLLYPAKLSFKSEGQMYSFPDKKKLKEFIITKPLSYEMLQGLI